MQVFLKGKGINYSKCIIHKYMNKELKLLLIVRRKKPKYIKGDLHKVYPNLLNKCFIAYSPNTIWCTDFTYMYL